jgi:hypothetical protein
MSTIDQMREQYRTGKRMPKGYPETVEQDQAKGSASPARLKTLSSLNYGRTPHEIVYWRA